MPESMRAAFEDYRGSTVVGAQGCAPEARPVGRLNPIERAITRLLGAPGLIAHRNTLEAPRRLAAIVIGIGFAVFVATSQVGLLLGFIECCGTGRPRGQGRHLDSPSER